MLVAVVRYYIRPHKCRAYLSKSALVGRERRDADEDQKLSIATTQLANDSVGIYKAKKCVMHPSELGQSVLKAIENHDLQKRWANGELIFDILPDKIRL